MKKLLLKLSCFFGALLAIKLAFVVFCGDKFVYQNAVPGGNKYEVEYRKTEFAKDDYNAVFVGSSRTALGVSPTYFDSLTGKTKSYNFGIIAGMPPATFDWCEELIETKPSLKYVFFELSGGFFETAEKNDAVLTFFKPSVPRAEYANFYPDLKLPLQNIPLEEFLKKQEAARPGKVSPARIERARARNARIEREIFGESVSPNEDYWRRIAELIELAEAKQIRLYFFIPPRLKTDHELEQILQIYQKLERKYKLKVAHHDESLYRPDSSLDDSHLNYKGAKRFTDLLAEAFEKQGS